MADQRTTRMMKRLLARFVLCGMVICLVVYAICKGQKHSSLNFSRVAPRQRILPNSRRVDIPHIIHQKWNTIQLPKRFVPWVKSWLEKPPTWQYWFWTDEDARRLVERDYKQYLAMYDGYKKKINRADAMRYFVLQTYGGFYADIDMECLKPLDEIVSNKCCILAEDHHVHSYVLARRKPPRNVLNTPMACRPGHPYFKDVISELAKWKNHPNHLAQTGPDLIDRVLRTY